MTTDLVAYLSFDGECQAAFKHYEKVLGGKILMMMRHADAPANAGVPQTPETANRIMHARLKVGGRLLMGGDAPPQFASKPQGFCVSIMVDDPTEAERIFRELGEGGVVRMPIAETFWARRFGMLLDKYGELRETGGLTTTLHSRRHQRPHRKGRSRNSRSNQTSRHTLRSEGGVVSRSTCKRSCRAHASWRKAKGGGGASESIHHLRRYLEYLFNQLSCKEK